MGNSFVFFISLVCSFLDVLPSSLPRIVGVVLYGARKVSDYDGVSNRAAMGFFAHFREVYEQRASRESLGLVARLPMHAASNHTTRA